MEGPCKRGDTRDCPERSEYVDPFYYYEHTKGSDGGAVTGSTFVPDGLWPNEYKFLFIDFVFGRIYNLIKDEDRECRSCEPPVPAYRNETFFELDWMVDMFFGPYKDTSARYITSRSVKEKRIRRIRSTGSSNRSPVAEISVSDTTALPEQAISFDARKSYDPDGDSLTYQWDFGDDIATSISRERQVVHAYTRPGVYTVEFSVTDTKGQSDESSVSISVGVPPKAEMIRPRMGQKFAVGEIFRLSGSAVDWRGEALPPSQIFWEVRQHHSTHWHPFLDRKPGNDFILSPAPEPEDFNAAENSYLEVIMYAVDSRGLTTTVSRKIRPKIRSVRVNSDPSGLEVLVDEFPVVTPGTIKTWYRHTLRLDVSDQYPFMFKSWSDGGARRHTKKILAWNTTITSLTVTFARDVNPPPLMVPVRECSTDNPCQRCEGHCEDSRECESGLVCYDKGGPNFPVPSCDGFDESLTKWCIIAQGSSEPLLKVPVRECSPENPCERCEGHCEDSEECQSGLVCYDKGGPNFPVPGCTGFDKSLTKWCTLGAHSSLEPPLTSETSLTFDPPLKVPVRECSPENPCERCEGHCKDSEECQSGLVCYDKGGPNFSVPGCTGFDETLTKWCTRGIHSSLEPPLTSETSLTFDPPLKAPVRECSSENPCERCEGDCDSDADCAGSLVCFDKGGENLPVRGCSGIDESLTDWCTIA